jgi:hypothetical protein
VCLATTIGASRKSVIPRLREFSVLAARAEATALLPLQPLLLESGGLLGLAA